MRWHKSPIAGLGNRDSAFLEPLHDAIRDLGYLTEPINRYDKPPTFVEINQRRGLLPVHLKSVTHYRFIIIRASLFDCPLTQALHHNVGIRNELNDNIERSPVIGQELIEVSNLISCPGVTIEKETTGAVLVLEAIGDEVVGQRIRHIVTSVHERFRFQAQFCLGLDVVTENIARGNCGDAECLRETCCLGAFPGARRTNQEKTSAAGHFRSPS